MEVQSGDPLPLPRWADRFKDLSQYALRIGNESLISQFLNAYSGIIGSDIFEPLDGRTHLKINRNKHLFALNIEDVPEKDAKDDLRPGSELRLGLYEITIDPTTKFEQFTKVISIQFGYISSEGRHRERNLSYFDNEGIEIENPFEIEVAKRLMCISTAEPSRIYEKRLSKYFSKYLSFNSHGETFKDFMTRYRKRRGIRKNI